MNIEAMTMKKRIHEVTKAPYYKPVGKEIEVFEHSYKQKLPVLLKGPTGTGKSRFIEFMAHQLNKELITVSCHEETSSTDLIRSEEHTSELQSHHDLV